MPVIEIQNVSKSFAGVQALKNVSFSVEDNEIFGLIGPDGAGKTTLFRIIVSLLLPGEGKAGVCGFDVVGQYKEIRKRVGYMAGRFSLYLDLTVEENLKFYASVFGTSLKENYDMIRDIYSHIEPFKNRKAGALSGGMKQKLALSCALIHKPRLLVLDEPTTGVDAVSRKEFWDLLHKIRQEGISIIVSTPYMDEASRCDRVGLIQKGVLMTVGKPGEIAARHSNALFRLRAEKSNYELLNLLRKQEWCRGAWLFGQDIHLSVSPEIKAEESKKLFSSIKGILNFESLVPGVEDTFIELMARRQESR